MTLEEEEKAKEEAEKKAKEAEKKANEEEDKPNEESVKYLKSYIDEKLGLARFYNDEKIKAVAPIAAGLVAKLRKEKGCTFEIARDMQVLALYDLVMLIDDSTTIESKDGGQRKETLRKTLQAIVDIYAQVRDRGISSVRFFNGKRGKANVKHKHVEDIIKDHAWRGVTRIGTELKRKILDQFVFDKEEPRKVKTMEKPLLIMIITDGEIEGEHKNTLQSVIQNCVKDLEEAEPNGYGDRGADNVAFHFSRVGEDEGAEKLLNDLETDVTIGKYIDCLPVKKSTSLETMVKDDQQVEWSILAKLLLGAIHPDWGAYNGRNEEPKGLEPLIPAEDEGFVDDDCGA